MDAMLVTGETASDTRVSDTSVSDTSVSDASLLPNASVADTDAAAANGRYNASTRSFSIGVSVSELLALMGKNLAPEDDAMLQRFKINFTHIFRPNTTGRDGKDYQMGLTCDMIKSLYLRCAALYAPEGFDGVDFLCPMYCEEDGSFGLLLGQTKNMAKKISSSDGKAILEAMDINKIVPNCPGLASVCIAFSVGSGKANVNILKPSRVNLPRMAKGRKSSAGITASSCGRVDCVLDISEDMPLDTFSCARNTIIRILRKFHITSTRGISTKALSTEDLAAASVSAWTPFEGTYDYAAANRIRKARAKELVPLHQIAKK
jgi:hypothetical protein